MVTFARKNAVLIGILFILGTAFGIFSGSFLNPSLNTSDFLVKIAENQTQVSVGGLLILLMGLSCAAIGPALYPVLKIQPGVGDRSCQLQVDRRHARNSTRHDHLPSRCNRTTLDPVGNAEYRGLRTRGICSQSRHGLVERWSNVDPLVHSRLYVLLDLLSTQTFAALDQYLGFYRNWLFDDLNHVELHQSGFCPLTIHFQYAYIHSRIGHGWLDDLQGIQPGKSISLGLITKEEHQ